MSKTGRPAETDEQTRGVRVEVDLRGGCGVTNGKIASGYLFFLSFHQKRVKASTAMPITAMMIIGVIIDGSMMSLRTSVGGLDSPGVVVEAGLLAIELIIAGSGVGSGAEEAGLLAFKTGDVYFGGGAEEAGLLAGDV